jgi:hypothetical protein
MLDQTTWGAALFVGRTLVDTVTLSDGSAGPATTQGGPFGGLGGRIGDALGANRPEAVLTAAWLEYEVRVPGRKTRVIRRAVFDLLGAAARATPPATAPVLGEAQRLSRSLSLMTRTEILPVGFALAPEFLAHLAVDSLLGNADLLRQITRGGLPRESDLARFETAVPLPSPLYALALARLEASNLGGRIYIDRPSIFARHRSLSLVDGQIVPVDSTDIVANEVGVSLTTDDAFAVRLEQGVFDTNAEALILRGPQVGGNTATAFAASRDWLTLTSDAGEAVSSLGLSENARRSISQDIDAGFAVVAPPVPIRERNEEFVGWWRIDRRTGDTLGVAANGWGQAAERSVQYNVFVKMAEGFIFQEAFCRVAPLALEPARPFIQHAVYLWGPKWWVDTLPPPGDDKTAYEAGKAACIFGFMAQGVMATLPLVMLTLRFSSLGRLALKLGSAFPFKRPPRPPRRPWPPRPRKPSKPQTPKPGPRPPGPERSPDCGPARPATPSEPPLGPYRGDPAGRELLEKHPDSEWLKNAGVKPQDLLDAFKKADAFADATYNDAVKSGMSDASAHRVSQDAWLSTYDRVRPLGMRWDSGTRTWVWETRPPPPGGTHAIPPGTNTPGIEKGPYHADPVGLALLKEHPDSVAVALMGGAKTVRAMERADTVAARYYQDMRASGMSDASAHEVSRDVWHDVHNRFRGNVVGRPVPSPSPNQTMPSPGAGQCGPSPLAQSTPGIAAVNDAVGK